MKFKTLLLGVAVMGLLSSGIAFADDYLGGVVKTATLKDKPDGFTDAKGMTLYIYDTDVKGSGISTCYDKCAVAWPPLWVAGTTAVSGDWTLIDRTDAKDGMKQVAYKGLPLYYWFKDTKAGDVSGDNVGKVWHIAYE